VRLSRFSIRKIPRSPAKSLMLSLRQSAARRRVFGSLHLSHRRRSEEGTGSRILPLALLRKAAPDEQLYLFDTETNNGAEMKPRMGTISTSAQPGEVVIPEMP
jgi:hypothetical protein